jgi:hypothetical protein
MQMVALCLDASSTLNVHQRQPFADRKQMDTLSVTTSSNGHPQISPGSATLRKINEVLALSTPSPTIASTADEVSPLANEESIRRAEQLKAKLMQAIDNVRFLDGS